jgi:nicotinamidase-related amidase
MLFIKLPYSQTLKMMEVEELIIGGCKTEYCIDTTCRKAVTLGFNVILVGDAHSTTDNEVITADQIRKHYNLLLDGFKTGSHQIIVRKTSEVNL